MNSIVAIVVVALVAVASGSENGNRNVITDIIEGIINANRGKLANVTVEHVDLAEFGNLKNLIVLGVDKFVLEKLDAAGPLSVDIKNATITLESATATSEFLFNNAQIPELGLIVNGAGNLVGLLKGLFATVALDLSLDNLKPHLEDFSGLYINIETIEATLTGVDNVDSVNEIINSGLVGFLNANLVPMAEANKAVIIAKINEVLDGLYSK